MTSYSSGSSVHRGSWVEMRSKSASRTRLTIPGVEDDLALQGHKSIKCGCAVCSYEAWPPVTRSMASWSVGS